VSAWSGGIPPHDSIDRPVLKQPLSRWGDPADHRNILRSQQVVVGEHTYRLTVSSPEEVLRHQRGMLTVESVTR
jgi:hypothetical protein